MTVLYVPASLDTLLDMVAVIAPLARPADPRRCSMRKFNAARAGSPFPGAPTANAIHLAANKHAIVSLSWPRLVELAFAAPADREALLRAAHRTEEQDWLTPRHLFYALNRVARFLDQPTLIPRDYREGRQRLIRRERRRDPDAQIADLLPTEGQIERIAAGARAHDPADDPAVSD